MAQKTLQQAYETIRAHLIAQGRQATYIGKCMYRAEGGLKCAIGALIDDEHYERSLELSLPGQPSLSAALRHSGWPVDRDANNFYAAAQNIHDEWQNWSETGFRTSALALLDGLALTHHLIPIRTQGGITYEN